MFGYKHTIIMLTYTFDLILPCPFLKKWQWWLAPWSSDSASCHITKSAMTTHEFFFVFVYFWHYVFWSFLNIFGVVLIFFTAYFKQPSMHPTHQYFNFLGNFYLIWLVLDHLLLFLASFLITCRTLKMCAAIVF
jgi:hypothetical protein